MSLPGLRLRVLIVAALLAGAFGGVTLRLAELQLVRHAELGVMAERQYARTVVLHAERGPVVDRDGHPLAVSSPAESLFAQPRQVGDPVRVAAKLAPILQIPEAELRGALVSPRPFVWLQRRLPPAIAEQVKALREPGLGLVTDPLRLYPNRELAAHVVGFEGVDGGLEGIEGAWNKELAGTPGKAVAGRDALGREVTTPDVLQPPVPGHGVMLTLDTNIQHAVEREIDAAWRRTEAKGAMSIVLDPRTGDVLALAIRPTFNPNTFLDVPSREVWRNRAITDPFEPGSTFKAILAAAALEERVVRPEDLIFAENGSITIARTTIRDWKKYGWLTFAEVLENSSNVGAIKVGLALGPERYHRYMTAFGFGAPTAVGLPGESRGQLREPTRWSALSLPTMSIGQEVSVTALQMAAAFGAIANGGTLMQPRLVRAVFDVQGRELRRFEPRAIRQVISPETAQILTGLLARVVENGTARRAAIAGYAVAGKTGTAQKLDPTTQRYSRGASVLSFVGFAPADAPRFVMIVLLDEPRTVRWGGEAAAPLFGAIGQEIVRQLHIPPQGTPPVHVVNEPATSLPVRLVSAAGVTSPLGGPPLMPDLRGRSLRQALAELEPLGLSVDVAGRGIVVQQKPAPDAELESDTTVRLVLSPRPGPFARSGAPRGPAR